MNPRYLGDDNMVAKILYSRLSESLKMRSPGHFALPNYPLNVEFRNAFAIIFLNIHQT